MRRPFGQDLVVYEKLFGNLITNELAKQRGEKQTASALLQSRGEQKARLANKGHQYNVLMDKTSTVSKSSKPKKNVTDAFRWARPAAGMLRDTDLLHKARHVSSLEFKTPRDAAITLNLAGSIARLLDSMHRSFVFEISTTDGVRYVLQASKKIEADAWVDMINKASEMAMLRRKTLIPPSVPEVQELPPLPSQGEYPSWRFGGEFKLIP